MCGEQASATVHGLVELGSSPRVRGTVRTCDYAGERVGIIPACAGNSSIPSMSRLDTRDHPRVCGEQEYKLGTTKLRKGSSPRVRGTEITYRFNGEV